MKNKTDREKRENERERERQSQRKRCAVNEMHKSIRYSKIPGNVLLCWEL